MKVRIISILVVYALLFGPVVFVDGKGKGGGGVGSRGAGGGGRKSGVEEKSRGGGRAGAVESAKGKGKSDAGAKVKDASEGRGKAGGAVKGKDSRAGSKVKVAGTDNAGKAKALGKEHQKQLAALKRQVIHEQQKHLKRSARLGRIRLLAVESGNAKMIARIDKLIFREQGRYVSKAGRMDKKKNVIMGIAVGPKVPVEGEVKVKIKALP